MLYRKDKYENPISSLGFGCMRFTKKSSSIDLEKAEREVLRALDLGVNFFDTAYIYPGSEEALGKIMAKNNLRDKILLSTKLPQYMVRSVSSAEKYLGTQLQRLQTDHIDYYFMHHITSMGQWTKLKDLGIEQWIEEKKQAGTLRQIGFSYHGNAEDFKALVDAYPWDFCLIQLNYMDAETQAGVEGLRYAASKGLPVFIMEPLRGGRLVNQLPPRAKELISAEGQAASLALRWLWNMPEVTCVLSGMNSLDMIEDNCNTASLAAAGCLTESESEIIEAVKKAIEKTWLVDCTACNYCMPCPKGVDIPALFTAYNRSALEKVSQVRHEYTQTVGLRKEPAFATQCIGCGACERVCPQHLPIIETLKKADSKVRPWYYRMGLNVARRFMKI